MKAVILVESGFQDEEVLYPYYRFKEEGWEIEVASPDGSERKGKYGLPARVNKKVSEVFIHTVDCILVPGGYECPDRLRLNLDVLDLLRLAEKNAKLISAICHGPWVLISAGIVSGRTMTSFDSVKLDLQNAGAVVSLAGVVEDRNIITADHYRNLGPFMKAIFNYKPWPAGESHAI